MTSSARASAPSSAILTFLIADIRGYTAFTRTAGDEAAARLAEHFAELVREGVEAEGGNVVELRGDEALCVFGSARQALRAAVALQGVFLDETTLEPGLPVRVGIGLDVGEAVPVEDGYRGAALNLAARLCASAGPGEILASEGILHLAGPIDGLIVEARDGLELKGYGDAVKAHAVRAGAPAAPLSDRRIATDPPPELDPLGPIVGRDREARSLRWSWRLSRHQPGITRVVIGPTGVGKTRLVADPASVAAHDGASILYASAATNDGSLSAAITDASTAAEPVLLVLDDLESASDEDVATIEGALAGLAGRTCLTIVVADDSPSPSVARLLNRLGGADETLRLGPLDEGAVGRIVELYAADAGGPLPVRAVAQASDGIPERVHALAAEWAQSEFTRRLDGASSRAASGRRDLRRLEAEVATNLVDLQLARERLSLLTTAPTSADRGQTCPFMGLASFDVDDADLFFGRERLVAEMIGRLAGASFLGVVGPSGSGKSSAVRAGLVPAIETGALSGAGAALRVLLRPGEEPMRELDRMTFAALDPAARERLRPGTDPLAAAIAVLPDDRRLLVVVDQFEELFTSVRDPAERSAFINALVAATVSGRAVVIAAVRADFYGRCAEHPDLAELLAANHVLVGPMGPDEYRRAIEGPARRAGLRVEPALVSELVADVIDQPGGLPLLSTALVELWEQRAGRWMRLETYRATGGVSGAVGRLAETAYGRLTEPQQAICRSIFLRLASGEGDTVVGRRVPLVEFDAATNQDVERTLAVLTDARLLSVDEGTVAVAHEALFREWPRFVAWLDEDREGRRLRAHLAEAAREWNAGGRDMGELYRGARLASTLDWTTAHTLELNELERTFVGESRGASESDARRQRRTNRRLRLLLGAAGVALLVAIGAGTVAVYQGGQAEHAATAADAQRLGAQALVVRDLDLSLLLARQGYALDDSPAAASNLLASLSRSPGAIAMARPLTSRLGGIRSSWDGSTLVTSGFEGQSAVMDAATLKVRYVYDIQEGDRGVDLADDGTLIILNGPPRSDVLKFFSPVDGHPTGGVTYPSDALRVYWAPDLRTVGWVNPDGSSLTIADAATLAPQRVIHPPAGKTFGDLVMYRGGHLIALTFTGDMPEDYDVYGLPGSLDWWGPSGDGPISSVTVPALGQAFQVSGDLRTMSLDNFPAGGQEMLADLATGVTRPLQGQHAGDITGSSFSPDGSLLVTGGDDFEARVWNVASGALRETLSGHTGVVRGPTVVARDGQVTAYTAGMDSAVVAWDLTGSRRLAQPFEVGNGLDGLPEGFDHQPTLAVSPDGAYLAAGDSTGIVLIDARTHAFLRHIDVGVIAVPSGAAFSPDGTRLAVTGSGSDIVQLYDTTTWTSIAGPLPGPSADRMARPDEIDPNDPTDTGHRVNLARSVAFSADSRLVTIGTEDGKLWTWDAATGASIGSPIDVGWQILDVSYDPENGWLAASYDDFSDPIAGKGLAAVFAPGEPKPRYVVDVDSGYGRASAVAFSPDGALLATGGGRGDIRFWDAGTGVENGARAVVSAGWVLSLDWAPQGDTVVSAGTDGSIRLIDARSRLSAGVLPGVDSAWAAAAWSPDALHVYGAYEHGQNFDWTVDPTTLAAQACRVAARTLTTTEWQQYLPGRPYDPACATTP